MTDTTQPTAPDVFALPACVARPTQSPRVAVVVLQRTRAFFALHLASSMS